MPRPISQIEIYLPLDYNNGRPIEEEKHARLEDELLDRFGGVTSTYREFPLQGVWKAESQVFRDRVVIFSVMNFRSETELQTLQFLEKLKSRLKKGFRQKDVLITVQSLLAI
jgi:hypothetical protein